MKKVVLACAIIVMMCNITSCSVDTLDEELLQTEATVGEEENSGESPDD